MKKYFAKRRAGRLLSILLIVAMLFSLAGCGKEGTTATATMDKDHVYTYEEFKSLHQKNRTIRR